MLEFCEIILNLFYECRKTWEPEKTGRIICRHRFDHAKHKTIMKQITELFALVATVFIPSDTERQKKAQKLIDKREIKNILEKWFLRVGRTTHTGQQWRHARSNDKIVQKKWNSKKFYCFKRDIIRSDTDKKIRLKSYVWP